MTTTRSLCLSLEFDLEGERVTGWLADERGNDWAFSCWLDLLALFEQVLAGARLSGEGAEQFEAVTNVDAPKGQPGSAPP
jgi:hypothetical protein